MYLIDQYIERRVFSQGRAFGVTKFKFKFNI